MSSADFKELLLHHLAPGLGCVITLMMFVSPLHAIQHVRKKQCLGELNPLPLVAIIANCMVWLIYGCFTRDPYIIAPNGPGLMLGVFFSFSAYGFAGHKMRDLVLWALLFFTALISSASIYICLYVTDHQGQVKAAGYQAVAVLLLYYAAPLSSLAEVLRSWSCISLHAPLSAMSCANGALWVTYGLAVQDPFVWGPNAVGAAFGLLQLLLLAVLPRRPHEGGVLGRAGEEEEEEDMQVPLMT
ncbi:sugar efflux transporter for intercellular exchange-domain-containing protein [Haematococcus lacustris]